MSGFLARVAARAVGEAPLAGPRLPTVFERAQATPAEGGLEGVDAEVSAGPLSRGETPPSAALPRPGRTSPTPASDADPIAAPARRRESAAPEPEAPAAHALVPRAVEPLPEIAPATGDISVKPLAEASHAVARPDPVARAVPAAAAVAAVAAVPVAPAVLGFRARPAPSQEAVRSGLAEPPTVRVHIGRLEVRANLQEAPPPRPRRAETAPPGPSLADYLRGHRTAG